MSDTFKNVCREYLLNPILESISLWEPLAPLTTWVQIAKCLDIFVTLKGGNVIAAKTDYHY
jgi:hypothetical protein